MVNCSAAYQAILLQKQKNRENIANIEDLLDADMARLTSAVQTVGVMLDDVDCLLKVFFINKHILKINE